MNTVPYFSEKCVNDYVYSVDKLVIAFFISEERYNEIISEDTILFKLHGRDKKLNSKNGNYPYFYSAEYGYSKMTVSIGKRSDIGEYKCYIELNPNKCFKDEKCIEDLRQILSLSNSFRIQKADIAVDIPVRYEFMSMLKDRRYYNRSGSSISNLTFYLGKKRGRIGYVKLYNKTRQSSLPYDLTRIEMTLGNPLSDDWNNNIKKTLPTVFYLNPEPTTAANGEDEVKLSLTDNVLISLLRESSARCEQFKLLDYKKQQKIKPYVFADEKKIIFDTNTIRSVAMAMCDIIEPQNFCIDGSSYVPIPQQT